MRKIVLITGLVFFTFILVNFALPEKQRNIIGTYRSQHYGFLRKGVNVFFWNRHLTDYGAELKLYPDSTFLNTSRNIIMTGQWLATKDTLYLHILTNKYRIDSLNRTGRNGRFPKTDGTIKFKISANTLARKHQTTSCSDSTKKYNALETLVKIEEQ